MVNTKEVPPEAILLGVYLELQNGWLDHYGHTWLPGRQKSQTFTKKLIFTGLQQ